MDTQRTYAEDAAHVYALAYAYFYDARVSGFGLTTRNAVQEIGATCFEIWPAAGDKPDDPALPLAVCSYNERSHTWKVDLASGEMLTLRDSGGEWDMVLAEKSARERHYNTVSYLESFRRRHALFPSGR